MGEPIVSASERAAARAKIVNLLRGLPTNICLDVSNMTPNGEGIQLIHEDEVGSGKYGQHCFTGYQDRFVSDNYDNYFRALTSFAGGDFKRVYRRELEKIRSCYPDW